MERRITLPQESLLEARHIGGLMVFPAASEITSLGGLNIAFEAIPTHAQYRLPFRPLRGSWCSAA
jgi:hypothetical protein